LLVVIVLAVVVVVVVLPNLSPTTTNVPGASPVPQGTPLPTATPFDLSEVVVAVQKIPRGFVINEGAVAKVLWPKNAIPQDAETDPAKVVGLIARTDIYVDQPIVSGLLATNLASLTAKGSDAAAVTPNNRVLISVPIDRLTDVGYAVQDGDYVDVIVSFLFVDVDPNFQTIKPNKLTLTSIKPDGTIELLSGIEGELQPFNGIKDPVIAGPSEAQRPRLVTQRTIQAAWVVHVGTFPLDGNFLRPAATPLPTPTPAEGEPTKAAQPPTPTPPNPDIVTLAVEPQEAVALVWLIEAKIPFTLVLRSAQGDPRAKQDATTSVSLQYMIETFQVSQPPSLPYALEPALRSIRSLQVGNQISLQDVAAGK
jgi:Flp pilus assembly protein CpaB